MQIIFKGDVGDRIDALVEECDKEIGWLGLADPVFDKQGDLVAMEIPEIFVPNQTISHATVAIADEAQFEYMDWLTEQGRAEDIARIRYFGHSHVHMGVGPSGTDLDYWNKASRGVDATKTFVASIHNKKGEFFGRVHLFIPGWGLVFWSATRGEGKEAAHTEWAKETIKARTKTHTYTPTAMPGAFDWSSWRKHTDSDDTPAKPPRKGDRYTTSYGRYTTSDWKDWWDQEGD